MTTKPAGPQGISDETVIEKTGTSTDAWNAILDGWDAPAKGHPAIARYLEQEHGISGWWAQTITVRYEYAGGLRKDAVIPDDLQALLEPRDVIVPQLLHQIIDKRLAGPRPATRDALIGRGREQLASAVARLTNAYRTARKLGARPLASPPRLNVVPGRPSRPAG